MACEALGIKFQTAESADQPVAHDQDGNAGHNRREQKNNRHERG